MFPSQGIPRLGRIVNSTVTSVSQTSEKTITTADGATHRFDFLVLAPGVSYSDPLFKSDSSSACATLEARRQQVTEAAELLREASSVVVVGGGPVGVELAAEIADDRSLAAGRKITLITSADRLLHPKPAWVGNPAEAWLKAKGVEVVKGQRAEEVVVEEGGEETGSKKNKGGKASSRTKTKKTLKTSSGTTIEADVVYWCG